MTAGPRVLHALLNECAPEHRYLLTGKVPERDRRRGPRQPRSVPRAPAGRGATAPARRRSWSRSKGPSGAGRNPFLVEMCISLSRTPVGTALSLSHWARRPVGPDRRGARAGSLVDAGPAARSPGNPRARLLEVRSRGLSDVLAGWANSPRASSGRQGARHGRHQTRGRPPRRVRGGAGCPNLLQRPRSSRSTEREKR